MGYADRDYYRQGAAQPPSRLAGAPVVKWLLILNIGVFILDLLFEAGMRRWCEFTVPGVFEGFQLWRLVTFQFLHADVSHILFNMIGLFVFGSFVEPLVRSRTFLAYYLLCGVAGAVAYTVLVTSGYHGGGMVGASAGLYGLLVLAAFLGATTYVQLLFFQRPFTMRQVAVGFLVIGLIVLIAGRDNLGGRVAHLGGALAGFVLFRVPVCWRFLERIGRTGSRGAGRPGPGPKQRRVVTAQESKKRRYERKLRPKSNVSKADADEVDRILDKINEHGLQSLTEEERLLLTRAGKK